MVSSAPARPTLGGDVLPGGEEAVGILARADVLSADVPVHPQVAAQLHADLARRLVSVPGCGEERLERRMQVALLGDATLDRADLVGSFDPVADLAGDLRVPARVP